TSRIAYTGRMLMYNNRISNINCSDANGTITAIRSDATNLRHNSVRLTGAVGAVGVVSQCVNGAASSLNDAYANDLTGSTAGDTRGIVSVGTGLDFCAIY